jgi:hypothetical protein
MANATTRWEDGHLELGTRQCGSLTFLSHIAQREVDWFRVSLERHDTLTEPHMGRDHVDWRNFDAHV